MQDKLAQDPKKVAKFIIIGFLSVIGLSLLWLLATHGVLIVRKETAGEYSLRLTESQNPESETSDSSWKFVRSGSYVVEYKDESAQYIKNVTIPSFLRSATVDFKKVTPRHIERVAAKTLDRILLGKDNTIVSTSSLLQRSDTLLIHPATDPTGLDARVQKIPLSGVETIVQDNTLIGFTSTLESGSDLTPTVYNFSEDITIVSAKQYADDGITTLIKSSTSNSPIYGVFYADSEDYSLDVYNGNTIINTFTNLRNSAGDDINGRALSLSENYLAVGYGASYSDDVHSDEQEAVTENYTVKIYDVKTREERPTVNLGKVDQIAYIHINDDASYVSVLHNEILETYNTNTSEKVFIYDATYISSIVWLDNQRILFGSTEDGLYQLDVVERSAVTLFTSENIRISSFSVYEDRILFTAFSNNSLTQNSNPDGYVAYINKETTDNNILVSNLPYQNSSMKLTTLYDVIYVAENARSGPQRDAEGNYLGPEFRPISTTDESFKSQVKQYLDTQMPGYEKYPIVYGVNL